MIHCASLVCSHSLFLTPPHLFALQVMASNGKGRATTTKRKSTRKDVSTSLKSAGKKLRKWVISFLTWSFVWIGWIVSYMTLLLYESAKKGKGKVIALSGGSAGITKALWKSLVSLAANPVDVSEFWVEARLLFGSCSLILPFFYSAQKWKRKATAP